MVTSALGNETAWVQLTVGCDGLTWRYSEGPTSGRERRGAEEHGDGSVGRDEEDVFPCWAPRLGTSSAVLQYTQVHCVPCTDERASAEPTARERTPTMSEIVISSALFQRRAAALAAVWASGDADTAPLDDLEYLLLVAGNSDEDNPYRKISAIQVYLLGYEFPSTLMLMSKTKVTFIVSTSKVKHLTPLLTPPASLAKESCIEVEILERTKDEAHNKSLFVQVLERVGAGGKVGTLPKDKMSGKFVTEWNAFVAASEVDVKQIDATLGVSTLLSVKDEDETRCVVLAAKMGNELMSHFSDEMGAAIDQGKKVTHEQLGEQIEAKLEDTKFWRKLEMGESFMTGFGDWCYSPIIQSGGNFDLKPSVQTDDKRLQAGVILCSLGIRYKSYCSNVGRTFLIDPDQAQEKNYLYLVDLQKYVLAELKDGAVGKELYTQVVDKIEAERPDLSPYFVKTLGFGMGIEFRDTAYALGPKCARTIKTNMIFSITLGFQNIPNSKTGPSYALSLVDTVRVGADSSKVLSPGMKGKDDVMFYMEDEKKPTKSSKSRTDKSPKKPPTTTVVKSKLRGEGREIDAEGISRRKTHQKELASRRQADGLEKYSEEGGGGKGRGEKMWRRFEAYARESQLPEAVTSQKITVDSRKGVVILPINGFAVPMHINTLKNVIKQEEGDFTVLRFMFVTPGAITGKKEDTPFEDPTATFIRGVTYRSVDSFRFTEIHKEITELKKAAVKKENEKKEMADVVEQDKLAEIKGKRPVKLTDVQVRPSFDGKRQSGDVEIHTNGIRYQSSVKADQKIDILFSNMKHLLFQPCDGELIVVLHIHLKNPILIGKKKAKDIQFYREASDASFDETGNKKRRKNYHDEDELQSEQEERKRRADLNKYFKAFADKIAEASDARVEVDIPFRELGFLGVPFRSNVLLQPTTDTLVFLTEPPFLVLTLADIEVAHLERVQYGLKNFDMVFVFNDFSRAPIHINTIPSGQLDNVKEWLDSVDIPYSEGPVNLNWSAIMKTVNEDPQDFFAEGGWGFLAEKDDEQGSSDESSDGSEFAASSAGAASSESGSEFGSDDDASADSGSEASDNEGESSGDDWDEAEEKLEAKERNGGGGDSDDDKKKKKKR